MDNDLEAAGRILDGDPAQLQAVDEHGWAALHWAAANRRLEMLDYLLSRGADVNARGHSQETPLHVADCPLIARSLIRAGADPHAADDWGVTAMDWAAQTDDWGLAAVLATPQSMELAKRAGRG